MTSKEYWQLAASDPDVDIKYICDISTDECLKAIGKLKTPVLEIGCGVGRLMKDDGDYYGIDLSDMMLTIAMGRKPKANYHLTEGHIIPYPGGLFNSAYSMLVFQHIDGENFEQYINETARVLRHNGIFRFQFIEGSYDSLVDHKHKLIDVKNWLDISGFKITKIDNNLVHPEWTWITAVKI